MTATAEPNRENSKCGVVRSFYNQTQDARRVKSLDFPDPIAQLKRPTWILTRVGGVVDLGEQGQGSYTGRTNTILSAAQLETVPAVSRKPETL
jgi:hypothetical protein